jgi:hypothetical protein
LVPFLIRRSGARPGAALSTWSVTAQRFGTASSSKPSRVLEDETMVDSELFRLHLVATLVMVGVIWMVQLVHYPLFQLVGRDYYRTYHLAHTRSIARLVVPVMVIEAVTAVALVSLFGQRPGATGVWAALVLLGVIWGSTALIQVRQHQALARGFDAGVHRALVLGNWLRTVAWTLRGAVLIALL